MNHKIFRVTFPRKIKLCYSCLAHFFSQLVVRSFSQEQYMIDILGVSSTDKSGEECKVTLPQPSPNEFILLKYSLCENEVTSYRENITWPLITDSSVALLSQSHQNVSISIWSGYYCLFFFLFFPQRHSNIQQRTIVLFAQRNQKVA